MNTQNTPVHIHLWHRDFWLVSMANLLLSMSVTMLIPTLPQWMLYVDGLTAAETGTAMGAFALGLLIPGAFCSFLVEHYRRNMVCVWSAVLLALSILPPLYLQPMEPLLVVLMRVVQGVGFGLAQMVLASTLVIDTCESSQRTEANHSVAWFGRFALSLGPFAGLLLYDMLGLRTTLLTAAGCSLLSVLVVLTVHIPFRVPNDHLSLLSLDRFFLPKGWPLLVNMLLITVATGLLFSLKLDAMFYALLMLGFMLALLAQRFAFADAELKSEVVTGLIAILAALFIMLFVPASLMHAPLLGFALGIIGSRFLLFFIKLSDHCQRGTAQSTYQLGWESGIALGIGIGYACLSSQRQLLLYVALALIVVALTVYSLILHQWFIGHKKR